MTQKNILKILVIMIAVLSLFAVSCRKASTSPEPTPTPSNPTDPIKSLTDNLLIVSTDGKTNLNSLPLSFVGASATVTEVTENPKKLNLDTTNFIVENNALKLTKFDLSKADAAVSNKVTLTFSLSGENLSRYTDTADIFVGKYSNIYTNTFDTFTNLTEIQGDDFTISASGKHKYLTFKFNDEAKTFFKDNTFNITNNNTQGGDDANELNVKDIESILKDRLQKNTIFTTYFNDVKVSFVSIDQTSQFIATFKVDLTPKSALFETPYTSYNFTFNALKGKWVQ
ncbi:hypothetical protein EPJ74_00005 [Brachyspira aalborgi]|uniref:Lipoprotein n=1 Tax=Brachyspira aalborgi TaxID=29522 RepID=A0A5C8GIX8_9SPIR|nr:hypothetical protein [Brachyspira aalborgi]TXJ61920.1 hypothetical protein EPJ74_00005 [Brachyspira aalborgi]